MTERNTYKYHLKRGKITIRSGITNDLDRREREHQRQYGKEVYLQKVGRVSTKDGAKEWENQQKKGTP